MNRVMAAPIPCACLYLVRVSIVCCLGKSVGLIISSETVCVDLYVHVCVCVCGVYMCTGIHVCVCYTDCR